MFRIIAHGGHILQVIGKMLFLLLMMSLTLVGEMMYDRSGHVPVHDELILSTPIAVAAMKLFSSDCWPSSSWSTPAFFFSISAKPPDPSA